MAQSDATAARASESIDDVVTRSAALQLASGAVLAIVWGDSIVFLKSYGAIGPEPAAALLEAGAVFHAGALTELVNAVAAAQLASTQPEVLTKAVDSVVPELPPELHSITLAGLLSHTSGLAYDVAVPGRGGANDLGAAARQLTKLDRVTDPGLVYSPSLTGAALAGLVLERLGERRTRSCSTRSCSSRCACRRRRCSSRKRVPV